MTTATDDRQAALDFFVAYFGARPRGTSHRQYAASAHWCRVSSAFLDPEGHREGIEEARASYERKEREGDPLAGTAYNNLTAAEAAEERARELRDLYKRTLLTGELPEYWRGHAGRPGARQAARRFEAYLTNRTKPRTAEQAALFA